MARPLREEEPENLEGEEVEDEEQEDDDEPEEALEQLADRAHDLKEDGLDALDAEKPDKAVVLLKRAVRIADGIISVVNAAQDGASRLVRKSWLKDAESIKAQAGRGLRRIEAEAAPVRAAAPVAVPVAAAALAGDATPAVPSAQAAKADVPAAQPVSGSDTAKAA